MKKEFSFFTEYADHHDKRPREIKSLAEVRGFMSKLGSEGFSVSDEDSYVNLREYQEVPLDAVNGLSEDEDFKEVVLKGSDGLEIMLKNEEIPSRGIGGMYRTEGIEGYIRLSSRDTKDYEKVERLIQEHWPEGKK